MEGFITPRLLTEALKDWEDRDLIEVVSRTEWKLEKNKWSVNEAALGLYDAVIAEWMRRHGKKHLPRVIPIIETDLELGE